MKKWVVFLGGFLAGIVTTFILLFIFAAVQNRSTDSIVEEAKSDNNNITMFDEPGDIVEDNVFEVFQVIAEDAALVNAQSDAEFDLFMGKVYLLVNKDGKYYYDEERIKASNGKVFRQVGIYRYPTRNESIKTVPIIMMMDK